MLTDKYGSFAELAQGEVSGRDYAVQAIERPCSAVLVVAPHGGSIEVGTSELAALVAGEDHSLFDFKGLKPRGQNRDLHVTSHRFDHPACVALASRCDVVLGVHGCIGEGQIYLGGRDVELSARITARLNAVGLPATAEGHRYPGLNPLNICNRGARKRGAQIEITRDLRVPEARMLIASEVRIALAQHVDALWREAPPP